MGTEEGEAMNGGRVNTRADRRKIPRNIQAKYTVASETCIDLIIKLHIYSILTTWQELPRVISIYLDNSVKYSSDPLAFRPETNPFRNV